MLRTIVEEAPVQITRTLLPLVLLAAACAGGVPVDASDAPTDIAADLFVMDTLSDGVKP